jgi:dihydrolipoamide dehydrogenase
MEKKYDLTIIGGGPGGYVAAIRAARLGMKTAVVEEGAMGGTCLNRGCIPTKALLHSAEMFHMAGRGSEFGIDSTVRGFDYGRMVQRKSGIVQRLRAGVESLVRKSGGTIIPGRASIVDSRTISVEGKESATFGTEKIIIATGSRPFKPPLPGIEGRRVLDSDEVLELKECPESVVIIGGGVIGVEFATLYNLLGKKVTVIEAMATLIPALDPEISGLLRTSLESRGIGIFTGAKVSSITSGASAVCSFSMGGKELRAEGDLAIMAVGRRPNIEGLGLEALGVALEKGFIKVDSRMETSVKGVYAIGDVTGRSSLAHVASAQGLIASGNASGLDLRMDYAAIPSCVYGSPEIATVGISEDEAKKAGFEVGTGRFPVSANGKSMILGEKDGIAKFVTDRGTGEILGCQIMGARATEMIAEVCVAMRLESTIEELAGTIHPHPTVSEMLMEAAHDVSGDCLHVPARTRVNG